MTYYAINVFFTNNIPNPEYGSYVCNWIDASGYWHGKFSQMIPFDKFRVKLRVSYDKSFNAVLLQIHELPVKKSLGGTGKCKYMEESH